MTKRFLKNQISGLQKGFVPGLQKGFVAGLQKRICAHREESPPNTHQILALDAIFQYHHPHTKN